MRLRGGIMQPHFLKIPYSRNAAADFFVYVYEKGNLPF